MKKLITLSSLVAVFVCVFLAGSVITSCKKPTDCKVTITVLDSTNTVVSGATVRLYANTNPPSQVQSTGYTDGGGVVTFNFKLPAIFNVSVTKIVTTPTLDTLVGTGLIQLQIGQTVSTTITVK